MNSLPLTVSHPREVVRLLKTRWRQWLIPAVVVAAAAALYAVVASPTWEASQALIIRNDATNGDTAPGKFRGIEEMKTIQETILALARSRGVLAAALAEVGPPADYSGQEAWPSDRDVDSTRNRVVLAPPKGAVFGATEVFYVEVRDKDRVRAVALCRAICERLQARFQDVRDAKAQSMVEELDKTVRMTRTGLEEATKRLTTVETEVGNDLPELRILNDGASGDGLIRRTVTELESELRQARAAQQVNAQLLALLRAGQDDRGRLLAAPSRLLESQPALKRLKDGLVDAQLRSAQLQGHMSAAHPLVIVAKEAEEEIGRHLHNEMAIAIRGSESELQLNKDRAATLEKQLAQAKDRLNRLAGLRAVYANQLSEAGRRTKLVERAEQNLAEARAARASAKAASLISRIDAPDTGPRPVSPSRATIILVGILGGLASGFAVVLLSAQPLQPVPASASAVVPEKLAGRGTRRVNGSAPAPAIYAATPLPLFRAGKNLSLKQALHKVASRT